MTRGSGRRDSELVEVRVAIPLQHVDAVCDFIVQNICNGMVLEDEEGADRTNVIFYSTPPDYEKHSSALRAFLPTLFEDAVGPVPSLQTKRLMAGGWEEQYRHSVEPVVIDNVIYVRPPWAEPNPACAHDIVLEPKMAFGTGRHETTRSCLRVLLRHVKPKQRFLDLGCGSGILSILAAQLGAVYIKAIDYDQTAVENCRENFQVNKVAAEHELVLGTVDKCRHDTPYDVVCANIIKSTILSGLPAMIRLTAASGVLVLSGLLEQDLDDVTAALRNYEIKNLDVISDNEWRTITAWKVP